MGGKNVDIYFSYFLGFGVLVYRIQIITMVKKCGKTVEQQRDILQLRYGSIKPTKGDKVMVSMSCIA